MSYLIPMRSGLWYEFTKLVKSLENKDYALIQEFNRIKKGTDYPKASA